jgi:hypothetical protein
VKSLCSFGYARNKRSGAYFPDVRGLAKYLQCRDNRDDHIPMAGGPDRWVDGGLGTCYRHILLPDDLIRPARGHATVFAAYSERSQADQAIFHAELTPFFKRKDWKLERVRPATPLTLPCSLSGQQPDEPSKSQSESAPDPSAEVWDVVERLVDISR